MKTNLILIAFLSTLSSVSVATAADAPPPAPTIEQRFQEADVTIALAQYVKLQEAAADIRLKLVVAPPAEDKDRDNLEMQAAKIQMLAEELRKSTIGRAASLTSSHVNK